MMRISKSERAALARKTAAMIGVDAWLTINAEMMMLMYRGPITGDELQALTNDIWQRRQGIIDERKRFRGEA